MAAQPAPEHALLAKMAGRWKAEITSADPAAPDTGDYEAEIELGGLWLTSEFSGTMMGSPFVGHDLFGFDPFKKKYVGCWTDSWSSYMVVSEGDYDAATKTLTMSGDSVDPASGGIVRMVNRTKFVDDDHMLFTMHMGGADAPAMMTIRYTRK